MVSPHLLRPFSSRQLSLVSGEGRVLVFAVLGGRFVGSAVQAHAPTLARRVAELPGFVEVVAFIEESFPDGEVVARLDDMIATLIGSPADAVVRRVEVSEAVKRVEGNRVVGAVDRSLLVAVRSPEVVRRAALENAVGSIGEETWVGVTGLVVRSGGRVLLYDESRSAVVGA